MKIKFDNTLLFRCIYRPGLFLSDLVAHTQA